MSTADELVERAVAGDREALDELLRAIQHDVYNLAVRMLWSPDDAADATQEILIKVATRLATFRRESALRTWVYRIATNHLLNVRRSRVERENFTFSSFGTDLANGLADPPAEIATQPDQALLVEEVKIGCTMGMLLCLDREHRAAYVLGDVFQLSSDEASEVLEISSAAYRKRLSRARERLRNFMREHCGLVNAEAACRCNRRVTHAVATGRVHPDDLLFAGRGTMPEQRAAVAVQVEEMEDLHRIASLYRAHPEYASPEHVLIQIRQTIQGRDHTLLR